MAKQGLTELREEMRAVVRGERAASPVSAVGVLAALATPANFELLRVIIRNRPESVSRVAELTGRDELNISRALKDLHRHGLIRLVRKGQAVRPVAVATRIDIDLTNGTCSAIC